MFQNIILTLVLGIRPTKSLRKFDFGLFPSFEIIYINTCLIFY